MFGKLVGLSSRNLLMFSILFSKNVAKPLARFSSLSLSGREFVDLVPVRFEMSVYRAFESFPQSSILFVMLFVLTYELFV